MLDSRFWEKYFVVYDVLNQITPYQSLLREIIKTADPKPDDDILDVGVGTGNLALQMQAKGAHVLGLDFSSEALEIYHRKNPKAETVLHDLMKDLVFLRSDTFDTVVSNNVLYNLPRARRTELLKDLRRILKPGGKIVLANVHKDFAPVRIYLEAVKEDIRLNGWFKTLGLIAKLFWPTLKIFYYNRILQKVHKVKDSNLFEYEEQKEALEEAGFREVSETKLVYAKQGILNSAYK